MEKDEGQKSENFLEIPADANIIREKIISNLLNPFQTHRIPESSILERVKGFLPGMKTAQDDLEKRLKSGELQPSDIDVENIEATDSKFIAMEILKPNEDENSDNWSVDSDPDSEASSNPEHDNDYTSDSDSDSSSSSSSESSSSCSSMSDSNKKSSSPNKKNSAMGSRKRPLIEVIKNKEEPSSSAQMENSIP